MGEKAQVACFVASSSDNVQFYWLKDGKTLSETDHVRLKHNNDFSVMVVDPVDLSSEGNYTCKATDGKNVVMYSSQLQVEG